MKPESSFDLELDGASNVTEGTREVIDLVVMKPEGGVVLVLVWLGPLEDKHQQIALQERINVYLAYWDSGQLAADFPDAAWKDVTIKLMVDRKPDEETVEFLNELTKLVETVGVRFEYELLGEEEPAE